MEDVYGEVIERHVKDGLLEIYCKTSQKDECGFVDGKERYLRLTLKGMDVSNYVMADFLEP